MTYWITRFASQRPLDEKNQAAFVVNQTNAAALAALDFQEINYTSFPNLSNHWERRAKLIDTLMAPVQAGDVVVVQFPLWMQLNFQSEMIEALKRKKDVKLIGLINAVIPYMHAAPYDRATDFFLTQMRKFDLLITANDAMSRKLQQDQIEVPMLSLMFNDFLYQGPDQEKKFVKKLVYVAEHPIKDLTDLSNLKTPLKIYGKKVEKLVIPEAVTFCEYRTFEQLPALFDGGFGLINAPEIQEQSRDDLDNYHQYDNPFSLSVFLAAGLPLIVLSNSPHAAWVSGHGAGLVLKDLTDLDVTLENLSQEDYQSMVTAIRPYQEAVSSGFFIKRTLLNAIRVLELGYDDVLFKDEAGTKAASNFLEKHLFYLTRVENYQKEGIWRFLPTGQVTGLGTENVQKWRLQDKRLLLLDENDGVNAVFDLTDLSKPLTGRAVQTNAAYLLVATDLTEIESLEIEFEEDRRDLSSFTAYDSSYRETLRQLALAGKIIDGYFQQHYFIVPNTQLYFGMKNFNNIPYEVEKPVRESANQVKKLIVLFPLLNAPLSTNARDRLFGAGRFASLGHYAPENTYILRLADNNLITGSYLMNTENAPDYEQRLQDLIHQVATDYGVSQRHIVTFGNSRGASAALLHGLLGNYPIVAVDPVISRTAWTNEKDEHLMFDFIPQDFTNRFNHLLEKTALPAEKIKIFTNE